MRNKGLQKKAINYGINKLTPFIQESVGSAMDELSTKVRPNKKYKTNRADLDGKGIDIHKWIGKLPRVNVNRKCCGQIKEENLSENILENS